MLAGGAGEPGRPPDPGTWGPPAYMPWLYLLSYPYWAGMLGLLAAWRAWAADPRQDASSAWNCSNVLSRPGKTITLGAVGVLTQPASRPTAIAMSALAGARRPHPSDALAPRAARPRAIGSGHRVWSIVVRSRRRRGYTTSSYLIAPIAPGVWP